MPDPDSLIQVFIDNDGLSEYPPGSNHNFVTDWYGLNDAWCAMMFSYAAFVSGFQSTDGTRVLVPGVQLDTLNGWQYVPSMVRKFIDAGYFSTVPSRGAAGFVVYPSSGSWVDPTYNAPGDHVCVVDSWTDTTVTTWDGNVGNKVQQVTRPRSYFYGYGYLPYTTEQENSMDQATQDAIKHLDTLFAKFCAGIGEAYDGVPDSYHGAEVLGGYVGKAISAWPKK